MILMENIDILQIKLQGCINLERRHLRGRACLYLASVQMIIVSLFELAAALFARHRV